MNLNELWSQPLFGVSVTVAMYCISRRLHARWTWLHPLLPTAGSIMLLLWLLDIPYESYKAGGDWIALALGPATVALGVPFYKQANRIKQQVLAILGGVTAGSICGVASAIALVYALHGTQDIMLAMLPKSATTPISVEIVGELGGIPELGAVFTVLTGLLGSMIGPEVLRLFGIRHDIAVGAAVGTAAHGIGTARVIQHSELQGSVSGFAMGLTGVVTSIIVIPLYWLWR